jgi:hypothetical protein
MTLEILRLMPIISFNNMSIITEKKESKRKMNNKIMEPSRGKASPNKKKQSKVIPSLYR